MKYKSRPLHTTCERQPQLVQTARCDLNLFIIQETRINSSLDYFATMHTFLNAGMSLPLGIRPKDVN